MSPSNFTNLAAYQHSVALADDLRLMILEWQSLDAWTLGVQLMRAVDSVGANIAEAYGRSGALDQRRLLYIARGSAHETEHWIARAVARDLMSNEFEARATELVRTLNGLIRSHHNRR